MVTGQSDEFVILAVLVALVLWWMLQQVPRREVPLTPKPERPQREIRAKRGAGDSSGIPIRQLRRRKAKEVRDDVPGG